LTSVVDVIGETSEPGNTGVPANSGQPRRRNLARAVRSAHIAGQKADKKRAGKSPPFLICKTAR